MPTTYRIVRYYQDPDKKSEVMKSGLSMGAARFHCVQPETKGTDADGFAWFDGFESEEE
jgi:hypothetical protein